MREMLRVELPWYLLDHDRDPAWRRKFCLYAYLHSARDWLIYIGKSDRQTVRQRLHGDHKAALFEFFWDKYGIDQVRVLQSDLVLEEGRRRSSDLRGLVESLLIMRLQPPGNIAYRASRPYRPGVGVKCTGDWPFKRSGFYDWT